MTQSAHNPGCAVVSDGLQIEQAGSDAIVFDSRGQLFHLLNEEAYSILTACTGLNSINDIALTLSAKFKAEDLDGVTNDVTETIRQFRDKGLVMDVIDDSEMHQSESGSVTESPLLAVSVTGTSMFPVLLSGDKVLVKRSSIEDLNVGDIVLWFHETEHLLAHRIISIDASSTPPLITTRGDLCLDDDPPVAANRVLGKIIAVMREGGVQWMTELDRNRDGDGRVRQLPDQSVGAPAPRQRPSYTRLKVLDLREISLESIRNIEFVEDVSLVLLSPDNAHAWSEVVARDVKAVFTVPDDYRVYTGQPELLPELIEFMQAPLRLVVSGQVFLTAFAPDQISGAFEELILNGQAYVSSVESKIALEPLTKIVAGEICVVPNEHNRWIGTSVLGPEYQDNAHHRPLVVVGDLAISPRMPGIPEGVSLYDNSGASRKQQEHAET